MSFIFQPAHIKAAFIGTSVTIPITNGKLNMGTWQGLWLCEHRNHAGTCNFTEKKGVMWVIES